MGAAIAALMGVTVAWFLNMLTDVWKGRRRKRKIRDSLRAEVHLLCGMIPQKQDIVAQCIQSLEQGRVLPTRSCHVLTAAYDTYAAELCECVNDKERSCLHFIYETLKGADLFLDRFFDDYRELGKCAETREGRNAYFLGSLKDLGQTYARVTDLIDGYLLGAPPDTLWHQAKGEETS